MMNRLLVIFLLLAFSMTLYAKTMYVVSVGICDYKYINDLQKTENDARSMAELYKTHTKNVTLLLGKDATHDAILGTITSVFAKANEDDIVVLFFSGHGGKGGLCAYDTKSESTMVSYAEVQNVIRNCKAKNKQMFIDACFSGGLRKEGKGNAKQGNIFSTDEGVMLFLSSRTGEASKENRWSDNGFFTQYLVRGIKGAADKDGNRIITAKEIFEYVHANVSERTQKKQNPVMWGKFSDGMHIMNWNPKK